MKKKFLALIMATAMIATLVGCGNDAEETATVTETETTEEVAETTNRILWKRKKLLKLLRLRLMRHRR